MWLVLNKGFLSIVNKGGNFVVRSRMRDHLEEYFPNKEILEFEGTDYQYRININKEELTEFLCSLPDTIDYGNFKKSIKEKKLESFCMEVWYSGYNILHDMRNFGKSLFTKNNKYY